MVRDRDRIGLGIGLGLEGDEDVVELVDGGEHLAARSAAEGLRSVAGAAATHLGSGRGSGSGSGRGRGSGCGRGRGGGTAAGWHLDGCPVAGTAAAGECGGGTELLGLPAVAAAFAAASAAADTGGAEICWKRRSSAEAGGTVPLPKLILRWPESALVLVGSADDDTCDWAFRSSDCGVR